MIPAEKIGDLLAKNAKLMETLKGEKLGGFALICPPEGDSIEIILMGSHPDVKSFYVLVKDKLVAASEANQLGGTHRQIR